MGRRASRSACPVTRTPATFSSIGNTLYGELYAPPKPKALVVLVFGSGQDSAVTFNYVQHLLPIYDIAVFVYDKRGTGKSTGRFTVDFSELADDAIAAVAQARKLLNAPDVPVGLMGESQGGWIAPLAAVRAPADFVVVSYGLAISPLEEDREEVLGELRAKHYDDSVMAKGRELTSITGRIMLSRFTDGLDDLRKFKAAHADEKWLQEVEGDFTGPLLRSPDDQFTELRAAARLRRDSRLRRAGGAATRAHADAVGRRRQGHRSAARADARIRAQAAGRADAARHRGLPERRSRHHRVEERGGERVARAVARLLRPAGEAGSAPASWRASSARRSCSRTRAGSGSVGPSTPADPREYPLPTMQRMRRQISSWIASGLLVERRWRRRRRSRRPPDLQGIWTSGTLTPFERPAQLGTQVPESARAATRRRGEVLGSRP